MQPCPGISVHLQISGSVEALCRQDFYRIYRKNDRIRKKSDILASPPYNHIEGSRVPETGYGDFMEGKAMADEMNVALDDDLMAYATGGIAGSLPYGYVCEATVFSGPESASWNGTAGTAYKVDADNGERYLASWAYNDILNPGDRVQLIHVEYGFAMEPIIE